MNFFLAPPSIPFSPLYKSGFKSRCRRSAAVIVLESWLDPCACLLCYKSTDWERKETGKRAPGSGRDEGRQQVGLKGNKEAAKLLAGNY